MVEPMSKSDFLRILRGVWRRHRLHMTLIFLGIALPGIAVLRLASTPLYVSSAMINVESSVLDQMPQFTAFARRERTGALLLLLKDRSFLEAVADTLSKDSGEELVANQMSPDYLLAATNLVNRWMGNPQTVLSARERAIRELQDARMEFSTSSLVPGVIVIRASASRPQVAADLISAHIQVLLSRTHTADEEDARRTREYLDRQLQEVKGSLSVAENNLTTFRERKGEIRLGARTASDMDSLSKLESMLAEAQASREIVLAQVAVLRRSLDRERPRPAANTATTPPVERDESNAADNLARINNYKAAQDRLSKLEDRLTGLRDRYTDEHPLVQSTRREIATQQTRIAQLARDLPKDPRPSASGDTSSAPTGRVSDLQQQLSGLETQQVLLEGKIDSLQKQVDRQHRTQNVRNLSRDELEFTNLQRTVEVNRNLLTVFTDKLMAARIREQGIVGAVRIITPPSVPKLPTQSGLIKTALLILLISGGIALGTVSVLEYWRQPVETEADVLTATDLPILGAVSEIVATTSTLPRKKTHAIPLVNLASSPGKLLHIETYRGIRTAIETARLNVSFRSILVTSPEPHEGKSTTILNLAHAFHEYGRRVVVIDADLRRPSLASSLGLSVKAGLVDYLSGSATLEQVIRTVPSGIDLIAGQVCRTDPGSLLAHERMRELLRSLEESHEIVLVDSAPFLAVFDSQILVRLVNRVVLVAKASQTSMRILRRTQVGIQKSGGEILGVILNQAHQHDIPYYSPRYRRYYRLGDEKNSQPDVSQDLRAKTGSPKSAPEGRA
jgi:capsular exopolysaccharide synthesis family protein